HVGDPRFPVTVEEWRKEIVRALGRDTSGYFCRVEPGTYIMGTTSQYRNPQKPYLTEEKQYTIKLDTPFLIARYPITNAQLLLWQKNDETLSSSANAVTDFNEVNNLPNQPVVMVNFKICNDFCNWLSKQVGHTIRLPNEYEWEAAARGGDARNY